MKLNLPTSFSFNGGNSIELLYDGLGTKLRRTVKTAGSVTLTQDYLGGIELKNNVVEAVYNEEGRAYNNAGTYRYEYVLRDHLGNTRLVFTDKDNSGSIDNSEILSESHYYPFGRKMDGAWYSDASAGKYRYLYNGKELSDEFDLNFYDYGARWYDPGLGSWWQIDPLAEVSRRFSPYVFSNNNPLRFVDPDGRLPGDKYDQWAQAKNAEAAAADQQGLEAYSAAGGGGGDPPTKKTAIPKTNKQTDSEEDQSTQTLDAVQTGLDVVGLWPGLGEIADGTNALIYSIRGDYVNAGLSVAAMVPFAGWAATGGKLTGKALRAAEVGGRGLWILTKEGASVIKNHRTFGTIYKSSSDGLWWAIDKAGHGGSKFKVFQETNKGLEWYKDADEFGDFIKNKHKGSTGKFIPWEQLSTVKQL